MKSILFTDEMVRSTLAGLKTKIRKPVKPQPDDDAKIMIGEMGSSKGVAFIGDSTSGGHVTRIVSPYGQVGDRLWVRETFCLEHQVEKDQLPPFDDRRPIRWEYEGMESDPEGADRWIQPHYRATDPTPQLAYEDSDGEPTVRWKPSIHMPRWASRITLEITDIRVERVQEITEEEAISEGFFPDDGVSEVYCFSEAWDSLYAKKGLGVDDNPWVWVLTFRRVESC